MTRVAGLLEAARQLRISTAEAYHEGPRNMRLELLRARHVHDKEAATLLKLSECILSQ